MTGTVKEHVVFFLVGSGSNGKSTLAGAVMTTLGPDYAGQVAPNLLFADRKDAHPTGVADLYGKRFAVTEGEEKDVRVSRLLQDAGWYRISAAKMKTHDTVIVTLSVKNAAMGAVIDGDKKAVHQGIRMTNRNIAAIAARVWPDLAVIDGVVGMEGDGPVSGDPIEVGVTVTSVDPLAADSVACEIMGLSVHDVGYLTFCRQRGLGETDLKNIRTVGAQLHDAGCRFGSTGTWNINMHGDEIGNQTDDRFGP